MSKRFVPVNRPLVGKLKAPGDKSISHRSVMFGAIAEGKTTVHGFLPGEDCLSTISCFEKLGVRIEREREKVVIFGNGLDGLKEPNTILDVGNSGTTIRLLLGILAGRPFHATLIGDDSIAKRPMDRVVNPLRKMGAEIDGRQNGSYTPISVRGGRLKGLEYRSPVASAQVKSAILLAGLQAEGTTIFTEPHPSRDHTERMLQTFGAEVVTDKTTVSIMGSQSLKAADVRIPADISSAAFFAVAAAITPGSNVTLLDVGLNPTRSGIIDVLKKMGASITIANQRMFNHEPVADIHVRSSSLKNIEISGETIPRLIDEIPILALAATQAEGVMVIKDAAELKVKETDRINTVVSQLQTLGASIEATDDGMVICGKSSLKGGEVDSFGDHRIGMMLAIASLVSESNLILNNQDAVSVSYPNFYDDFSRLLNEPAI